MGLVCRTFQLQSDSFRRLATLASATEETIQYDRTYLVRLHMCAKARTPLLRIGMHCSTVPCEDSTVDDRIWRSQRIQRLAKKLLHQRLFVGLEQKLVRRAGLYR